MNILLINPNRYKSPPVPPIGLEYIAASLESKNHKVEIIDLCFSENLYKDIDNAILSLHPDIIGITVRNIDSVLFHINEFFLDEIKDLTHYIKSKYGLKVVIGGTGISSNPEGILQYLNADFAIAGPAENTVHDVLNNIRNDRRKKRIYQGKYIPGTFCPRRPAQRYYKKYIGEGGVAGFETHKGCSSSCVYCLEAKSKVSFKPIEGLIEELKSFADIGCSHFHLCDSEFNENLEYSAALCNAIKNSGVNMQWALYMKPGNTSKDLFKLLKETGAYLITLSVDSWQRNNLYWSKVEEFISSAKSSGLKIAVDFLTGFPYESDDKIKRFIDFFRRTRPDSVGINTYIRLYKNLRITDIIMKDVKLRDYLLGNTSDRTFLKPVFYNHINADKLNLLINGDTLFRIEGLEKGVNYSRVISTKRT
jgi:radical SAM superfamily enzyme YgiQ (UPF0313 family)